MCGHSHSGGGEEGQVQFSLGSGFRSDQVSSRDHEIHLHRLDGMEEEGRETERELYKKELRVPVRGGLTD